MSGPPKDAETTYYSEADAAVWTPGVEHDDVDEAIGELGGVI